jgi:hypothetical protein
LEPTAMADESIFCTEHESFYRNKLMCHYLCYKTVVEVQEGIRCAWV